MTDKYTVHLTYAASKFIKIEADTPSEAVEKAYDEIGIITLCHQCDREVEVGDPIRYCVEDSDGKTVLEEEV